MTGDARRFRTRSLPGILATGGLALLAIVFFFPMVWMVLSSFKSNSEIFRAPFALPTGIDFGRWAEAWEVGHLGSYALNSAIVTAASVFVILICGAAAAFAFSRYRFRGRGFFMSLFALGLILPLQSYFIAQSQLFTQLAITDTRLALIIPYAAMGMSLAVYLLKVYMDALPHELFEAARIDGAGEFRIFLRIVLPLCKPILATLGIFVFLWHWNDFLWPLIIAKSNSMFTLTVGISSLQQQNVPLSTMLAGSVVALLPIFLAYLIAQRYVQEGVAGTGIKG